MNNQNKMIIYSSANGETKIEVKLENETLWLEQGQMAELFNCSIANISLHLKNIYFEGELEENSVTEESSVVQKAGNGENQTIKEYLKVQKEGNKEVKRPIKLYNLDAIISVGYRVNSIRGTQFRIWATQKLKEYIIKGFVLDDARLAGGKTNKTYFQELEVRIRLIRTSEANFYQKVKDIFATSIDYNPQIDYAKQFFAIVQNKFHSYAELQSVKKKLMYMKDWIRKLDEFLIFNEEQVLTNSGSVSHHEMEEKVRIELAKYNQKLLR